MGRGRPKGANPPLSAAEKQRRYRARRDADPWKREKYLETQRDRYRKDLESGRKKPIDGLSERKKHKCRRKWRETYHRIKNRKEAAELFAILEKTGTTIELFNVKEEPVEKAVLELPNDVPPVPSSLRMHDDDCVVTQNVNCECFDAKCCTVSHQQTTPTATEVQWQSPDAVGKWCVLKYDGHLYPGIIIDTSSTHVEVRCMEKIGVNRFLWPACEHILWCLFEDVVCTIPPPRQVTGRHMEIEKEVWAKLEKPS
ncbi:uncharacterized protein LOC111666286 [Seriola lalandi dorsalis]|uniref:uncharacterized protein LOC111666286 n=1 Tax=Seriola lalandi dorsalis TaxID=1841481 RepID=UPI000C6FCBEE|nr:uncharacterized protein LOC111666286 [Seriola lalandi dorsalis]